MRQVLAAPFRRIHISGDTLAVLVLIGVLGVGVWLYGLDRRGLWLDEIYQARCITPDWDFLLTCLRGYGNEPPLPYAVTFLWYRLAGGATLPQPDWFMRLPAAIAGILCIPVAWRLGDVLLGRRGAWLLALLYSVLPVAIDASQQVRQYSWLLLFSLIATLLLVLALKRGRLVYWAVWGISAALGVLSSYTTFLFLAGQGVFTLVWLGLDARPISQSLPERHSIAKILVGGLVGIATGLILLAFGYEDILGFFRWMPQSTTLVPFTSLNETYLAGMSTWLLWGPIGWWDIRAWSSFGGSVLVLGALVLLGLVWLASRERTTLLLVLSLLLSPLIYLFLGKGVPATPRFLLYLLVPYSLILIASMLACIEWLTRLTAKFATPLRANRILTASGALLVIVFLAPKLVDYYTAPYDDWRGAAAYIQAHAGPSDAILSFGKTFAFIPAHALQYYLPTPPHTRAVADLPSLTRSEISRLESRQGQVWGVVWSDGSFTKEQLTQWGNVDFAVVPFGSFTLLAPSVASGTTLAASAANLVVHFHELMSNVPDETKLELLSNAGGENLVQNPAFSLDNAGRVSAWDVRRATARVSKDTDSSSLVLSSSRLDVNEGMNAVQQIPLKPNVNYVFRFECRNLLTQGTQRVFVTFLQPIGVLQAFPDGGGYACPSGMVWHSGKIIFRTPPPDQANPLATIWLRNYGIGDVYFRNLYLSQIPSAE